MLASSEQAWASSEQAWASSEQAWDPIASSSAKFCSNPSTLPIRLQTKDRKAKVPADAVA